MAIEDDNLLRQLYPQQYKSKRLEESLTDSPEPVSPVITQKDLMNGYIVRYFVRPVNDKTFIVEINQIQYSRFETNPRFLVTQIKWKIVGKKESTATEYGARIFGVRDINIKTVSEADLTFGGLLYYISDYAQYWQIENLVSLYSATGSAVQS